MKRTQKGFTLVELLVVIAILAILATVSVVGYTTFIQKAHISNDTAIVRQMNVALQANEPLDGKNATAYDAVQDILAAGFDIEKLTPTAEGFNIVWDQESDRIALLRADGSIEYSDGAISQEKVHLWKFADDYATDGYSYYIKSTTSKTEFEVSTGIDVGENANITAINYKTDATQEVIIRTNSASTTLTIEAPNSTVNHFDAVGKVDIAEIDTDCYNEHGAAAYVVVAQGKVVVKAGGEIVVAFASSTENAQVVVEGGSVQHNIEAGDKTVEEVDALGSDAIQNAIVNEHLASASNVTAWIDVPLDDVVLAGTGTEKDPYKIANALQLALVAKNINNNVDDGAYAGAYYILTNNIDLTEKEWTPIGTGLYPFHGNFNGNGKTISGVTFDQMYVDVSSWGTTDGANNKGFAYGFFGVIGWQKEAHTDETVTIANLTLDVDFQTNGAVVLGGLVGADTAAHKGSAVNSKLACDIVISNITVNGKVISTNATGSTVGGVVGKLYTDGSITIDGCTNNAEVKSYSTESGKDNKVAGILGFYSQEKSVTITNNTNNGEIVAKGNPSELSSYAGKAAGICLIANSTQSIVNISNNTNNGDIYGTNWSVAAVAFASSTQSLYNAYEYTVEGNVNTGKLYSYNYGSMDKAQPAKYTYIVFGGESQTPADRGETNDKNPILEANNTSKTASEEN